MPAAKPNRKTGARSQRLAETIATLAALQFGPKQRNETAAYTLLALLDHLVHFNGERFLGPYPDVMPANS
jgi:hypothetical protein